MKHSLYLGLAALVVLVSTAAAYMYYRAATTPEPMYTYTETAPDLTSATTTTKTVGISERTYLERMIPHHEEAVTAAKLMLTQSDSDTVRELAQTIVETQETELATMKNWYQTWYSTPVNTDNYKPTIQDLSVLSGSARDRAFLEDMINHHIQALLLGQQVNASIEHDSLLTLTSTIAETQSNQIITMRMLLKQLPATL